MNGFLDWRELELQNDWGMREKSDAMGERWNDGAQMWDSRWKNELEFTRRQADALELLAEDSVLDVGCGTGPLTMHVAPRVQEVVAMDYGRDMLALVESNAWERGLTNVRTLQGNWYSMEPGREIPICDVAITRWSPAQGDILKFSRCARRWCYSLGSVTMEFAPGGAVGGGYWCRSTVDESLNTTPRPCGRKFGHNIHFNLLYDHGVNPTVNYLVDEREFEAPTKEELVEKIMGPRKPAPGAAGAPSGQAALARSPRGPVPFEREMVQGEDGIWRLHYRHMMVIMGWDPNELRL